MSKRLLIGLSALALVGCVPARPREDAEVVRVYYDEARNIVCYSFRYYQYDHRAPLSCVRVAP